MSFAWVADPQIWISLVTLTVLEIVLGIDNIIFISILAGKLPPARQARGRLLGLSFALVTRVMLLCSIFWLTQWTSGTICASPGRGFSGRDLVLLAGGLFLIWKSVREIHGSIEGDEHDPTDKPERVSFAGVVFQIVSSTSSFRWIPSSPLSALDSTSGS